MNTEIRELRALARPLDTESDLDPLLERAGSARYVLIGEASHGGHEYYAWRAALTRRLITDHGFSVVAVEGDAPECAQVDHCVRLRAEVEDPLQILDGLREWPSWLWSNTETVEFCRWLRARNATLPPDERIAWHGLEGFPVQALLRATVRWLRENEPGHLAAALDPAGGEIPLVPPERVDAVVNALLDRFGTEPTVDAGSGPAHCVDGVTYYRAMLRGGAPAWNTRDVHLTDMLDRWTATHGQAARAIVWAHNTHVGDARATDMADNSMVNLGQLVRERHGDEAVCIIGFAGGTGQVVAARRREAPMERLPVPAPDPGSWEAVLAATGLERALFLLRDQQPSPWTTSRPQRAIGVIFDPERETGHYNATRLADRYDALCWFSQTTPVHALHLAASPG